MQDEQVSIDRLEDQIIDHPDASTKQELHDSLDETFQKKLNARAEQIKSNQYDRRYKSQDNGPGGVSPSSGGAGPGSGTVNYQFLITKYHLQYEYTDYGELEQEINEWFTKNDLNVLGGLTTLPYVYEMTLEEQRDNFPLEDLKIELLKDSLPILKVGKLWEADSSITKVSQVLIYYSLGEYENKSYVQDQLNSILENNTNLLKLKVYIPLISLLQQFFKHRITTDKSSSILKPITPIVEQSYFQTLTLIYVMVQSAINLPDSPEIEEFRQWLAKTDLLSSLIEFIEHWKWKPNTSYRIRYLIFLSWKLILFEMGDSTQLKKCDEFLIKSNDIKNKKGKDLPETRLTCSPLDYFAFREDLLDKYPLYNDTKLKVFDFSEFHKNLDNSEDESDTVSVSSSTSLDDRYKYFMAMNTYSNSLTNLVERPKTNKSHTVLSQLPAQTLHIATPVPSPVLETSDYMSGGEKIRRSYQVNQAMPFIYPNLSSLVDTSSDNVEVPYAIKEADEILKNSVYESYSLKRLWDERQKFMKQERGYLSEYDKDKTEKQQQKPKTDSIDIDDVNDDTVEKDKSKLYDLYPDHKSEINSILRVERFYNKNLVRFNAFIEVLVDTIKYNRLEYNLNFAEMELNPQTSYFATNKGNNYENLPDKEAAREKINHILLSQLEVVNVKEITLKASTSIILLLLKWFKISHVLKYYYLTSILFDQQFFAISLDYLSRSFNNSNLQNLSSQDSKIHEDLNEYEILINQNKLMNPKIRIPSFEFFNNCLNLNQDKFQSINLINKRLISSLPEILDDNNINHVYISECNDNFAFILSNILKIIKKILIKNVTQRIFTLNELKPTELFKMIVMNYDNEAFTKPILKTLKKLIPYQGRKWKTINMDLISLIYLNLKLTLKDNWLSGKDLESDFNNSLDQEIALRALLQFYNIRKYPQQMESIGYHIDKDFDIPFLNLSEDQDYF
ncbi:factor arrest protein 11 [Scheffersomyces coipomensis]|uniref:factor arrest protein 11 n=1 Tax=Scheffersomyces coipomensis TaxID=1788519 RepID=UPI00315D6C6D